MDTPLTAPLPDLTLRPNSFPSAIDSTMVSTYRSCPMKFSYSFLKHLHADGKSIHLIAGGAFAAGLEAARRLAFTPKDLLPPHLAALPSPLDGGIEVAAFSAFREAWGDFDLCLDMGKSYVNTFYALDTYLRDYNPLTDFLQPMFSSDKKPMVECSFAIPLPIAHPETGDPILFCGRFDMLGWWENLPVVIDEKTTQALGESWRKQWDLRGQFLGYCWACQQLGYPVSTAIARGTAILKTKVNFMTVPVMFPQHLIDRWYVNLLMTVNQMIIDYQSGLFSYSFADGCTAYGGCQYSLLCSASNPEEWYSNYTIREWSPISPKGTVDE